MNCLCCGKPIVSDSVSGWHKSCIKHFFGTTDIPDISISNEKILQFVNENVEKGLTVPGVQKKLSFRLYSERNKKRLTIVNYPTGYILKPQVDNYRALPESEQLVMCMADVCGIATVPHALLYSGESYVYITKRIDRLFLKEKVSLLAMEDFCQLDLRQTRDKYKGSYECCAKIVRRYSCKKMFDETELFMRLIFCYVVGNSDMHLKNFSLLETGEGSGEYSLSPAYDLLPVNVIMPEDREELALTINGKKNNIHKKDFLEFAFSCDISRNAAEKMISSIVSKKEQLISMCKESLLPSDMKISLEELIEKRCEMLS